MTEQRNTSVTIGTPFLSLFFLLVFTFKVTGVISWPWIWVLAPVWIPIVLVVLAVIFVAIFDN